MGHLIPKRYFFVLGTFLLSLLLYIDRINISIAKEPIASDLGLSDTQMGWVMSIFALGYALAQTPSGILADKFGARVVLSAVVSFWSLFTALTGLAWNYISLFVCRFLFGIGEAGAFPGMARASFSWIPIQERGIVTGINFSGSRLGAAFSLPVIAWLIAVVGWRMSFIILGLIGFGWAIAWYLWFRDSPETHKSISDEEKEFIIKNRQQSGPVTSENLTLNILASSKNMWLAIGQYFASNFTFFFCLTWMFSHIRDTYNLELVEAGFYSSVPLLAGAAGNYFSGYWVDKIYKTGNWSGSRKIPAITGFTLAAIGLIGSLFMSTPITAILFLSIAIFGADMTLSPSWSFCVDIGRKNAGAVSGTMNMAGNLGSFITSLAFPYLLIWTGSSDTFFIIGTVLNVLAIALWVQARPDKALHEY
ncbi:MAG: MFS transporter [Cyclobacteriaceae bacterium]